MLPTDAGTYNACPSSIAVQESGANKLTCVAIEYRIFEQVVADGNVSAQGLSITGWHYIDKKDGTMNTRNIQSLKDALGWDGADLQWLQNTNLSQHIVQIVLDWDSYNGQDRLKVQWLNPHGSTGGGAGKSDTNTMQQIQNRIGAKLRAISGGTKRPAPAPTTAPTREEPTEENCTVQDAWDVFVSACKERSVSDDNRTIEWTRIIEGMFPDKTSAELTNLECMRLLVEGPTRIGKPGYTPPPADDEIPF